jgi:integrase
VQIPVHNEVISILDKRNGEFPPMFNNNNIKSNKVMFNRYLKELCKIAEINNVVEGNFYDEETERTITGHTEKYNLISSHICRRSFATNFYSNREYPTPLLMNITAHSTEKMSLEYIGKKPRDYGVQLAKIWSDEAIKKMKEPQLTVVKKAN